MIEAYTDSKELQNSLKDFVRMRATIKSQLTDRAMQMLLNNLDALATEDGKKIEILEQSIINSWKGIYPLKQEQGAVTSKVQNYNGIESHGQSYWNNTEQLEELLQKFQLGLISQEEYNQKSGELLGL